MICLDQLNELEIDSDNAAVLFFVSHARRELVYLNVTSSPTAAWVWQQLLNATPGAASPVT